MPLLEKEAIRFAESLDDYEHVTVRDTGGCGLAGHWLVVHDERPDTHYEIASHCDYWDFIGGWSGLDARDRVQTRRGLFEHLEEGGPIC